MRMSAVLVGSIMKKVFVNLPHKYLGYVWYDSAMPITDSHFLSLVAHARGWHLFHCSFYHSLGYNIVLFDISNSIVYFDAQINNTIP